MSICGSAMADKIWHSEISARGGKSKSPAKLAAVRNNLEKARKVQSARRAALESADSLRIAVRSAKRGQTGLPASICDKATRHDAVVAFCSGRPLPLPPGTGTGKRILIVERRACAKLRGSLNPFPKLMSAPEQPTTTLMLRVNWHSRRLFLSRWHAVAVHRRKRAARKPKAFCRHRGRAAARTGSTQHLRFAVVHKASGREA